MDYPHVSTAEDGEIVADNGNDENVSLDVCYWEEPEPKKSEDPQEPEELEDSKEPEESQEPETHLSICYLKEPEPENSDEPKEPEESEDSKEPEEPEEPETHLSIKITFEYGGNENPKESNKGESVVDESLKFLHDGPATTHDVAAAMRRCCIYLLGAVRKLDPPFNDRETVIQVTATFVALAGQLSATAEVLDAVRVGGYSHLVGAYLRFQDKDYRVPHILDPYCPLSDDV